MRNYFRRNEYVESFIRHIRSGKWYSPYRQDEVERLQRRLEQLVRDLPAIVARRREQLDAEKDHRIPLLRAKAKDPSVPRAEAAAFAAKADELAQKPTSPWTHLRRARSP